MLLSCEGDGKDDTEMLGLSYYKNGRMELTRTEEKATEHAACKRHSGVYF